jgi:hypothetical protein
MTENTLTFPSVAQSRGVNCFRTLFNANANGHHIVNAYLLMMVSRLIFPDQLNASQTDKSDFEKKFKERLHDVQRYEAALFHHLSASQHGHVPAPALK